MTTSTRPIDRAGPAGALRALARQSDGRLIELSRTGDEDAFASLVDRHRRELTVYAARLLGGEGRAEDIVQQALMSAWLALREREVAVSNPRAWLYGIVHNVAVTVLRRSAHECVELDEARDAPACAASLDMHLAMREIFDGVQRLPDAQRRALLLTAVAGATHAEAASALGVSDDAIRGLVHRARAVLRRSLAGVLPLGPWHWLARITGQHAVGPDEAAEAAGVATTAGIAAAVAKGGAVVATLGALAVAGPAVLHGPSAHHHHVPARPGRVVRPVRAVTAPVHAPFQPTAPAVTSVTSPAALPTRAAPERLEHHRTGRRHGRSSESGSGRGDRSRGGPDTSQSSGHSGGGPGPSSGSGGSGSSSSSGGSSGGGPGPSSGSGGSGSSSGGRGSSGGPG